MSNSKPEIKVLCDDIWDSSQILVRYSTSIEEAPFKLTKILSTISHSIVAIFMMPSAESMHEALSDSVDPSIDTGLHACSTGLLFVRSNWIVKTLAK